MGAIDTAPTAIPGLVEIRGPVSSDARGMFCKSLVGDDYRAAGLFTESAEEYYTSSHRGVVRGMHFQKPPHAHDKIVFCVHGQVFDVVADLRVGSPTFGSAVTFELSGTLGVGLYIPAGCAHGFAALSDEAVLAYRVTTAYAPEADDGILWSSVPVDWPFDSPRVSPRDASFSPLDAYDSPFVFGGDR